MKIPIQNGFDFQDLYCYPNREQQHSYYHIPHALQPQRDADGNPTITTVAVGAGGFLQLGVQWDSSPETLDALRQKLARQDSIEPVEVRLAFAPVTVQRVALKLGDGSGRFSDLEQKKTSGFPPYSAIFSVQLTGEQQAQVAAALNGRPGFLRIDYEASLPGSLEAIAKLTGDAASVVSRLKAAPAVSESEVQQLLQTAIRDGKLQIAVEAAEGVSDQLVERVRSRVLAQAAEQLLRFLQGDSLIPDVADLQVTASLSEPRQIPLPLQTDVATWFKGSSGSDHLQPAPGSLSAPASPPAAGQGLTVRLGFSAATAPIGLVRVRRGESQAVLSPPGFAAQELPAGAGEVVRVETSYTTGGPVYESQPAASGELVLSAADLGLARVTIDAQPLAAAGARKARIWVRYRPEAEGTADEQTLYFRDREWQASWFLVTRSAGLNGVLDYEWQVTTASDELIKHDRTQTDDLEIVLSLASQAD